MLFLLASYRSLTLLTLCFKVHGPHLFCLVESVDNLILAFLDMEALDEPVIMEHHSAHSHVSCLFDIGMRRIDNRDIVFLVTFDGVGFDQLRTVFQDPFWNRCPLHPLRHAEIHMC